MSYLNADIGWRETEVEILRRLLRESVALLRVFVDANPNGLVMERATVRARRFLAEVER